MILLPLDSTDASHKQINERQCSVTQITKWTAKLVTQYVYVTVATDSSERRGQTSSTSTRVPSIRFPSRTGEHLLLLFIIISWFPPRKGYYKYRHCTENTATIPKYAALVPQNIVTARQNTARILKNTASGLQNTATVPQTIAKVPQTTTAVPQNTATIPHNTVTVPQTCHST